MSIPLTQKRKNTLMKFPQKHLKTYKIRRIKMTHFKYTEGQEKGSIETIIDNEILASKNA